MLDHVASCARCTAELDALTAVADSLVYLAAEVEPPAGFENRVFDRLQVRPSIPDIPRSWHRSVLVSAAAAALVALAFGIGWLVHSTGSSPVHTAISTPPSYVAQASLVSGGQTQGNVAVYSGSPPWLFMTVSSSTWSGTVRCTITSTDGTTRTIGSFTVVAGHGSWGAPLPVAATKVQRAEVVAPDGHVLASARFT